MANVICGRCRHEHPVGARVCEACGSKLFALEMRRAMGYNPLNWIAGTAVGQMAPFALLALLLLGALMLSASAIAWRQGLLSFGLVGLVTLGVTFPLLKGHYDFSAGSLAGLAACCASLLSPYGYGVAIFGALLVGGLVGLLNGYLVGGTRLSSAIVTVMTGAVALQLTMHFTARTELMVTDPLLTSLGETTVLGIPVILTLFFVALALARVLLNQATFAPVGGALSRVHAAALTSAPSVMLSFLVSGLMAGIAGLLIASAGLALIGPGGQMVWMLTPLAAALIGGGSITAGTGNLRTATAGAAAITLLNWLATQLRMPLSGPVLEAPLLVAGLMTDRWKNMTWYMIAQARRGNLLALPDELQLPMMVRVWRATPWWTRLSGALGILVAAVALYVYIGFFVMGRVPDGTAVVVNFTGPVQITKYGERASVGISEGQSLQPGDTVTTGRMGQALLRFADGSEVRVYNSSELYIQEISTQETGAMRTRLHVSAGALFAKIRKLVARESQFKVQTPLLTLGVRGTSFEMVVDPVRGGVSVGEGAVELTRQVRAADLATGTLRTLQDNTRVEAGKAAQTGQDVVVREMSEIETQRLQRERQAVASESNQSRLNALKSRSYRGWWIFALILYLIFMLMLRPEPHVYPPDVIYERAHKFLLKHDRTPADSPRSAALAQMYLRAGDLEGARKEIQAIIEHDPNSEYGQWASRFWYEFERQRKAQMRAKKE